MKGINIILIVCFFLLTPGVAVSDSGPNILLLNSDRSVEKYKIVQEEFKKAIKYPVNEVYIKDRSRNLLDAVEFFNKNKFDLIYCIGSKAYMTAYKNVENTDIVFSSILNWRRLPEKPGIFGVSNELHTVMQIMLFRYIFPDIKKIGVLYSKRFNSQWFEQSKDEAKTVGIELIGKPAADTKNTRAEIINLLNEIDALWLISDPMVISSKKSLLKILKLCDRYKIPVFSYNSVFVKYGAMLIVSVDNPTIGRQAASIAQELLEGIKKEPNVQFPAGSQIILNLKKAKAFDLRYREEALGSVNRIIE